MQYLGDDEATQLRGIDLYQGTDGNLYEWVDGVEDWGEQELSQAQDPALSGLGALYQAPDGTLYQMQGLAEGEEAGGEQPAGGEPPAGEEQPEGEEPPMKAMGPRARRLRRFPGRRPQRPGPGVRRGARRKKGRVSQEVITHREVCLAVYTRTWRRSTCERWVRRGRQAPETEEGSRGL